MPGHRIGTFSAGPVRRLWCSCGWRWRQDDPDMALDDARRLERDHLRAHLALAQPPVSHDQPDWVRDRP